MATQHPTCLSADELLKDCTVKRTRGSGPGGQHRNKVETAIVITHDPTGAVGQASEARSQHRNREVAISRLRVNLALQVRSDGDLQSQQGPSDLWQSRIKSGKIKVNRNHFDFASLLAEAIDQLVGRQFELGATASFLNVSTSQLIKFFKIEPAAFEWLNRERSRNGLHRLK